MQDPDPKCRHFGILWQFMAFGIFAKKSDRKSDPIFPILSDFFRFLDFSRLSDSTALDLMLMGGLHLNKVDCITQIC